MTISLPMLDAKSLTLFEEYIDQTVRCILAGEGTRPLRITSGTDVPSSSGVYALYDCTGLIYVGESGCLSQRFQDLFETRHHTFRRKLGQRQFGSEAGFQPATSKRCFSPDIETRLTEYMKSELNYLVAPTTYCRCEIEERVVSVRPHLLNIRGRRGS
jgi:hypothetical protein